MKDINFEAYFFGPMGENYEFYKNLLDFILENHIKWRKEFHKFGEPYFISQKDKISPDFIKSQERIKSIISEISEKLKNATPFFSPRYIGHMTWETLAPSIIAFFLTSLYNPNNVAIEASPVTSIMEIEVIKNLLELFEIDSQKGWGHLCGGGTIANIEALWIARNMKFYPIILKNIIKNLKIKKDIIVEINNKKINLLKINNNDLLNMFLPEELCDLKDLILYELKKITQNDKEIDDIFEEFSIQNKGLNFYGNPGIILLPQTKHYSLKKALDILGIGKDNIRYIPVNQYFRMDIKILEEVINEECKNNPILAVVGVLGTTEEGSVDEIYKLFELRNRLRNEKGINFHIHIDAAYGGYVRSIFFDENKNFMDLKTLKDKLIELGIVGDKDGVYSWPEEDVYQSYQYAKFADTITIDPHKLGYVIYPAGAILMRNKKMREAIQSFAPYVFKKPTEEESDILIGAYTLEGSRPGASAASVWTAHKVLPLNIYGYGKLIGETIDGALRFYTKLNEMKPIIREKDNKTLKIKIYPLQKPDLNIVTYIFNFENNSSLYRINLLNEFVIKNFFSISESTEEKYNFIVSSTEFSKEEYGDIPYEILKKNFNISKKEWDNIGKLKVLRSVIMTPYLTPDYVDAHYVKRFIDYVEVKIHEYFDEIYEIYIKSDILTEFVDYLR